MSRARPPGTRTARRARESVAPALGSPSSLAPAQQLAGVHPQGVGHPLPGEAGQLLDGRQLLGEVLGHQGDARREPPVAGGVADP